MISNIISLYSFYSADSFSHIDSWLKDVKTQSNPDVKVFLIGNKTDLEDKRKVTKDVAEEFAKDNNLDLFIETSAKTGFNAKTVFIEAAKSLYIEHLRYKDRSSRPGSISSMRTNSHQKIPKPVTITEEEHNKKEEKKGCC